MKQYYVYILTNFTNNVLYTGVTENLVKRTYQHKEKLAIGFSEKYNIDKLVYYEIFQDPDNAIKREKTIKNLLRRKKFDLIKDFNPSFRDLYSDIV